MQRKLSEEEFNMVLEAFFKFGYSKMPDGECVGVIEYTNELGAKYNNVIGLLPNDDVTTHPLCLTVYSLAFDCEWQEAFDTYTDIIYKVLPELIYVDDKIEGSDLWEYDWRFEGE